MRNNIVLFKHCDTSKILFKYCNYLYTAYEKFHNHDKHSCMVSPSPCKCKLLTDMENTNVHCNGSLMTDFEDLSSDIFTNILTLTVKLAKLSIQIKHAKFGWIDNALRALDKLWRSMLRCTSGKKKTTVSVYLDEENNAKHEARSRSKKKSMEAMFVGCSVFL